LPRGYPDWGRIRKEAGIVAIGDLGELAVRLGSPTIFDRRGDVFFIDTFEVGLVRWSKLFYGTGAGVELSLEYAHHGGYSVKLIGGSGDGRSAMIFHDFQALWPGKWGIECACAYNDDTEEVWWEFMYGDGSKFYYFRVVNNNEEETLSYYDETGATITFATDVPSLIGPPLWFGVKLVVDIDTKEYVRFKLGQNEWDLTGKKPRFTTYVGSPYFRIYLPVYSKAGVNGIFFIDSVVVTFNEP